MLWVLRKKLWNQRSTAPYLRALACRKQLSRQVASTRAFQLLTIGNRSMSCQEVHALNLSQLHSYRYTRRALRSFAIKRRTSCAPSSPRLCLWGSPDFTQTRTRRHICVHGEPVYAVFGGGLKFRATAPQRSSLIPFSSKHLLYRQRLPHKAPLQIGSILWRTIITAEPSPMVPGGKPVRAQKTHRRSKKPSTEPGPKMTPLWLSLYIRCDRS